MMDWMNHEVEARLPGKISITSDVQMIYHFNGRKWRGIFKGERGELKSWLKTQHSRNEDYGILSHKFMANKKCKQRQTLFSWAPKSLWMVTSVMKLKTLAPWKESYDKPGGGGVVTQLCLTFVTSWTVAWQAPLSMGFPRQEYWSGLPFPSPGDLSDPRTEPWSPASQADSLLTELWGNDKPR